MVAGFAALFVHAAGEYRALRRLHGVWFQGDPLSVPDPEIGFGPNRGGLSRFRVRGADHFVDVATNLQGLRVPPDQRQTALAAADVVAVGCSFTFGYGVEAEQAYPAVAARTAGLIIANRAVTGYGTLGAVMALERSGGLHPKVVTYGFTDVHLKRNLRPCAPFALPICSPQARVEITAEGPRLRPPVGGEWRERLNQRLMADLDRPDEAADGWRGLAKMVEGAFTTLTMPDWANTPENQAAALAFLLRRMKAATDAMGARLVIVRIPDPKGLTAAGVPRDLGPPPEILLRSLPPGVELIDEAPTLAAIPPEQSLRVSPTDGHPGPTAHRAIGEDLGRRLRAMIPP